MKRLLVSISALFLVSCGAISGGRPPVTTPPPVTTVPVYTFGIVACGNASQPCNAPIAGADIAVNSSTGYVHKLSNGDGYALFTSEIPYSDVWITADGFVKNGWSIEPPKIDMQNVIFELKPNVPPMPAPPTRDEILQLHITFQGLYVQTEQYGLLPWFEPALPWLNDADRAAVYAAKHASTAWPGGDSHALIFLPSGPPLYDEPGQPYSADRFGPLDWSDPNDGRIADLVAEAARNGFNKQILFLGGDDGEAGFPVAMAQLDSLRHQLRESKYGDLAPYVVVLPGFDGVFYGYTPEHVQEWGEKCRALFLYCGLEHQPGRIPVGEGGSDYLPGGRMVWADLLLAEFNGPEDSSWRTTTLTAPNDYNGNQIWQIGARMLGSSYQRPSDQPANADSASPPFYLAPGSPRGPYVHCAFEWVGEYYFIRGQQTSEDQQVSRGYFRNAGWTCGG